MSTDLGRCTIQPDQPNRENVHSETYSLLLRTLVDDEREHTKLFAAIDTIPAVKAKADWCIRWMQSPTSSFATRLVAFAIVEGIFFSSSFAAIFWIRSRGLMPGLTQSNELIARDEGMHTSFACLLYRHLVERLDDDVVRTMVAEAVELEHAFFAGESVQPAMWDARLTGLLIEALPRPLLGMNVQRMRDYVEYVGDFLLTGLGSAVLYGKRNPVSISFASKDLSDVRTVRLHADNGRRSAYQFL